MSYLFQIFLILLVDILYIQRSNCSFYNRQSGRSGCNFEGRRPVPGDCRSYIECHGYGHKYEQILACPYDFHFSAQHGFCKRPSEAGCDPAYTTTRRTTPRPISCGNHKNAYDCVRTRNCDVCLDDSETKSCSSTRNFNCPQEMRFTTVQKAMKNKQIVRWDENEDEVVRLISNEGSKLMDLTIPVRPVVKSLSLSYTISNRGQLGLVQIIGNNCEAEEDIPANKCIVPKGVGEVTFHLKLQPDECWDSYLEIEVGFEIMSEEFKEKAMIRGGHTMKTYIFCNKELK